MGHAVPHSSFHSLQPHSLGTDSPIPSHLHVDSTGELRGDGARAGNSEELTCFEAKTPQTLKPRDTQSLPQDTTRNGSKHYETKFIKTFYKSDFVIQVSTYIYRYLQVGHSVFSFSGRFFYQYIHRCTVLFHRRVKLYHRYKSQAIMRSLVQRRAVAPCS